LALQRKKMAGSSSRTSHWGVCAHNAHLHGGEGRAAWYVVCAPARCLSLSKAAFLRMICDLLTLASVLKAQSPKPSQSPKQSPSPSTEHHPLACLSSRLVLVLAPPCAPCLLASLLPLPPTAAVRCSLVGCGGPMLGAACSSELYCLLAGARAEATYVVR
jgi:hypothetical protein